MVAEIKVGIRTEMGSIREGRKDVDTVIIREKINRKAEDTEQKIRELCNWVNLIQKYASKGSEVMYDSASLTTSQFSIVYPFPFYLSFRHVGTILYHNGGVISSIP